MIGWILETAIGRTVGLALLAAGATAIGGFYWSWTSRGAEIDRLTAANLAASAALDTAVEVNEGLRGTLDGERQRTARLLQTLAETERRLAEHRRTTDTIRRETRDAEDGPVAPVLARTLDGLRRAAGTAQGGDTGRVPAAADPAAPD